MKYEGVRQWKPVKHTGNISHNCLPSQHIPCQSNTRSLILLQASPYTTSTIFNISFDIFNTFQISVK